MQKFKITKSSPPFNYKQYSSVEVVECADFETLINLYFRKVKGGYMVDNYYNNISIDDKIKELKENYITISKYEEV